MKAHTNIAIATTKPVTTGRAIGVLAILYYLHFLSSLSRLGSLSSLSL